MAEGCEDNIEALRRVLRGIAKTLQLRAPVAHFLFVDGNAVLSYKKQDPRSKQVLTGRRSNEAPGRAD